MTVIDIAAAIVTALNVQFADRFAAERIYQIPQGTENDLRQHYDQLRVLVMPASLETELFTRRTVEDEFTVHVAVIYNLRSGTNAEIDALVAQVTEIRDFLKLKPQGGASWRSSSIDPVFDQGALKERRQFASLLAVTYRAES